MCYPCGCYLLPIDEGIGMTVRFARNTSVLLTVAALAAAVASVLPVRSWPLELLASFRVQTISVCLFSALVALLLRMRLWATLGMFVAVLQLGLLVPLLVSAERDGLDSGRGTHCTVLSLNLNYSNRCASTVIDMIRKERPDIIALQEVGVWWRDKFEVLRDEYPYQTFDNFSSRPGVGVLSRIEPVDEKWRPLYGRAFLTLLYDNGGTPFRFVALHTFPPNSAFNYKARNRQIDRAAEWIAESKDRPTLLAGDMNSTPWSPVLRDFERVTGLHSVRNGHGTLATWPSWNMFLGVPIDHIYHSDEFITDYVYKVTIPGSDHMGLLARLRISPYEQPIRTGRAVSIAMQAPSP